MSDTHGISTDHQANAYAPGDEITGTVSWSFEQPPRRVELRLFWYTSGKGTRDVGIAARLQFDEPGAVETRRYRFVAPNQPHSCSGTLVSISWALELVSDPAVVAPRSELVIGPGQREIVLGEPAAG